MTQDNRVKVRLFCPSGSDNPGGVLFSFSYIEASDDPNRGPIISWQRVKSNKVADAIVWERGYGSNRFRDALTRGFSDKKFLVSVFLNGFIDLLLDKARLGKKGEINFWQT